MKETTKETKRRLLQATAFVLALITVGNIVVQIIFVTTTECATPFGEASLGVSSGLAFLTVGLLIVIFRPGNRIGWLLCLSAVGMTVFGITGSYISCHLSGQLLLPLVEYVAWFEHRLAIIFLPLSFFILLPFWFPDGRFLTRRWKGLCLGFLMVLGLTTSITIFAPDLRVNNGFGISYDLDSPIRWTGLPGPVYENLFIVQVMLIMLASLAGIASMVVRFRRSRGVERQQMKWFAYVLAIPVIQLVLFETPGILLGEALQTLSWYGFFVTAYDVVLRLVFVGIPVVIGLTIFRYRLYEIDIIIRRTLVYGLITVTLAAVYFGSVVLLQNLFAGATGQQSPVAIVISTLIIAALFNPLRRQVQDFVDRRFYRTKYDAHQTLARFAQTARDETDLEVLSTELTSVIKETMQPETISVWLKPTEEDRSPSHLA